MLLNILLLGASNVDFETIALNIMFLVWIAVLYAVFVGNYFKNSILKKIGLGLLVSSVSILILSVSFEMIEGYLFDTRTVLFSLSGLFLGLIPTLVIALVTLAYRFYLGHEGVYLGMVLILMSSSYGLLWKYFVWKKLKVNYLVELIVFSLISGLLPFLLLMAWDYSLFQPHLNFIYIFYLITIPIITFLLSLILHRQKHLANLSNMINEQRDLLNIAINSPKVMEIYVLDKDFNYLLFNSYHEYCMKLYYGSNIKVGDSFLEYIKNSEMYSRYRSQIFKALQGVEYSTIDEVETTQGKYYESMFTPIRNDSNDVIGVAIFSYDVTKRKSYEIHLEYLNYHDALTNVYNRRYYNENMITYDSIENYPLCLILGDVNSLKTVNDAFGHQAGDEMLKQTADVLKNIVGETGFVSRIGGDEFIVLLKNTPKHKAEKVIKDINSALDQRSIEGVRLSMSIGYEILEQGGSVENTFKQAEDKMYINKLYEQSTDKNETINTIMKGLYEKNSREEMHSQRVSKYCGMIGQALKLPKDKVNSLKIAGILHDIGKIAIEDSILDKPGKLTDFEYERIKKHSEIGYRILSASSQYLEISKDILHHHEHYNGKGYPRGLKGENIPFNSRIIAVADAYDAMTLSRPYRSSFTKEEAIKELKKCSGTQFDPLIVDAFIKVINK